jgi:hypothetical protein
VERPAIPKKEEISRSPHGSTTLRQMPRVGMAVAIPSTLNTLLQTLSCTAFAIASAAVNQQPEDPGPRVVGAKLIKRAARECRSREGVTLRGSSTHHHRHERVLRLERALDPRGPRFEDVGLRSNGGGKFSRRGGFSDG